MEHYTDNYCCSATNTTAVVPIPPINLVPPRCPRFGRRFAVSMVGPLFYLVGCVKIKITIHTQGFFWSPRRGKKDAVDWCSRKGRPVCYLSTWMNDIQFLESRASTGVNDFLHWPDQRPKGAGKMVQSSPDPPHTHTMHALDGKMKVASSSLGPPPLPPTNE